MPERKIGVWEKDGEPQKVLRLTDVKKNYAPKFSLGVNEYYVYGEKA